jgi:cell division cycle 14
MTPPKFGQIIEYIPGTLCFMLVILERVRIKIQYYELLTLVSDRLYLASYTTPPTADTLFPYPDPQPARRSPTKRSARAVDGPSAVSQRDRTPPYYFSIDDSLLYNAFHHDFGPLHIGHLYRFAVQFHDILGAPENKDKPVVFWSKADARSKFFGLQ